MIALLALSALRILGSRADGAEAYPQTAFLAFLPIVAGPYTSPSRTSTPTGTLSSTFTVSPDETPTLATVVSPTPTPTASPTPSPIPPIFWTWTTTATVTPTPTETITKTPTPLPTSCAELQSLFTVELGSNAHYVGPAGRIAMNSNVTWWITVTGDHDSVEVSWGWENGLPLVISTPTTVEANGSFQFTTPALLANIAVVIDNPAPIGIQYDSNVQVTQQVCVNTWPPGWEPTTTPTIMP